MGAASKREGSQAATGNESDAADLCFAQPFRQRAQGNLGQRFQAALQFELQTEEIDLRGQALPVILREIFERKLRQRLQSRNFQGRTGGLGQRTYFASNTGGLQRGDAVHEGVSRPGSDAFKLAALLRKAIPAKEPLRVIGKALRQQIVDQRGGQVGQVQRDNAVGGVQGWIARQHRQRDAAPGGRQQIDDGMAGRKLPGSPGERGWVIVCWMKSAGSRDN